MDLPKDSPFKSAIMTIHDSGKKAASIVEDLLTLTRRGVPYIEIINFNDIIKSYLKSPEYKTMIRYHLNVAVKTHLDPDLLNLVGASIHLNKTLMNLMSNAAEAMQSGGTILVSTENRYIDVPIKGYDEISEGDFVLLTIIDTGAGINSEDLKRIFEPFYTNKIMGRSGTGLGMSVVWGTVQDHNGYIHVESSEGRGTKFQLYFPATRKNFVDHKNIISIDEYTGNGETILIIDDVREQREIAQDLLQRLKYSIHTVSSGEKAIEYLKTNQVDLLILDMIMDPGIDGLETYRQILKLHPKQKAIIASGFSENERVKSAQILGAGEYLKKPYTFEKIGLAAKKELGKL